MAKPRVILDKAANVAKKTYDKARDRHLCIGITGLSRSGKTTFITSLINQLCNYDTAKLAGLPAVQAGRVMGVLMHPLDDLPMFPYQAGYNNITAEQPAWPESTSDISGCVIELKLKRGGRRLIASKYYSLFLEIRDYPGEWLLDLPLMDMPFARWCGLCSAQYDSQPRRDLLGPLYQALENIDPFAPVDENKLQQLNTQFKDFLHRCKNNEKSLSLIQPGRFLIPGNVPDEDIIHFIPLLKVLDYDKEALNKASEDSYYKVCESRYQRYVNELVKPFYKDFFRRIDRQLILVDVIGALHAGPDYLEDMRQALTNISDSFAYGEQNRLRQLFTPKIDKLIFAATKIDQVLAKDHEAVRQLLSAVVRNAYRHAKHEGISPICEAVAAVRSSHESDQRAGSLIMLLPEGMRGYVPPEMPSQVPEGDEWDALKDWELPKQLPPKGLSRLNNDVIPHIRIDTILNELIGDKCL